MILQNLNFANDKVICPYEKEAHKSIRVDEHYSMYKIEQVFFMWAAEKYMFCVRLIDNTHQLIVCYYYLVICQF